MGHLTPEMKLKLKRDTYFIPDSAHSMYFRNNVNSFRMEGSSIVQWIEKLLPMFNGAYTLRQLTEGLPAAHHDRVYEIAEALYRNGYVRDVSKDHPHHLPEDILRQYASQIEFLDSFLDSSVYRFQRFRQSNVLAIGEGSFFISLVSALLESGLPTFHVLITDLKKTNRGRLKELEIHARESDAAVSIEEIPRAPDGEYDWSTIVQPFDSILYVSQKGDIEECLTLQRLCRKQRKLFIPALVIKQVGLAGPVVQPESSFDLESAWRRLHETEVFKNELLHSSSSTAEAMLANVIAFEHFKQVTGVTGTDPNPEIFLLNLETLEGKWHSFLPHPLVEKNVKATWIEDCDQRLMKRSARSDPSEVLALFSIITSPQTGIFHVWDQGNLTQCPLAQCLVQVADPRSAGPTSLLPEVVCTGLTHQEVRRDAGLTGVEMYLARLRDSILEMLPFETGKGYQRVGTQEFVGFGVGETMSEGLCRGLQQCLDHELRRQWDRRQQADEPYKVSRIQLRALEDQHVQYYLKVLTMIQGEPVIGVGENVSGFPVIWVGTKEGWYGSTGLNVTLALRNALQHALSQEQNKKANVKSLALEVRSVMLEGENKHQLVIPACEVMEENVWQSAVQKINRSNRRLDVFEVEAEPILKEKLQGIFGVLLREEEVR